MSFGLTLQQGDCIRERDDIAVFLTDIEQACLMLLKRAVADTICNNQWDKSERHRVHNRRTDAATRCQTGDQQCTYSPFRQPRAEICSEECRRHILPDNQFAADGRQRRHELRPMRILGESQTRWDLCAENVRIASVTGEDNTGISYRCVTLPGTGQKAGRAICRLLNVSACKLVRINKRNRKIDKQHANISCDRKLPPKSLSTENLRVLSVMGKP